MIVVNGEKTRNFPNPIRKCVRPDMVAYKQYRLIKTNCNFHEQFAIIIIIIYTYTYIYTISCASIGTGDNFLRIFLTNTFSRSGNVLCKDFVLCSFWCFRNRKQKSWRIMMTPGFSFHGKVRLGYDRFVFFCFFAMKYQMDNLCLITKGRNGIIWLNFH